jgi:hypothetical protein
MVVWEIYLLTIILHVEDIHALGYGHVYSIESHGGVMSMTYMK